MSRNEIISEEALKIHYFLLNNGFIRIKSTYEEKDGYVEVTLPSYKKDDLEAILDMYGRSFVVKQTDVIIFEIDNSINETSTLDDGWAIINLGDEITLDDIIPFFREDKLKDLFKNG